MPQGETVMTTQPQPIRHLDRHVARWIDLTERINQLEAERANIKASLRELGFGKHPTSDGEFAVTISPPARRFNPATAQQVLAPEVLELCRADGYDAKRLKAFLSPVLLDTCMDEGTGDPVVSIK